jgi:hypothetical protein
MGIFEMCEIKFKPFDLEKAMAGAPVVTRDGLPVRITCFDRLHPDYPITALVLEASGVEVQEVYCLDGTYSMYGASSRDLRMAPVKKNGWFVGPFESKEAALNNGSCVVDWSVDAIYLEWEE